MSSLFAATDYQGAKRRGAQVRTMRGLMGIGLALLLGLFLAACGRSPSQTGATAIPPQEATPRATFTPQGEVAPTAAPGSTAPATSAPESYDAVPEATAPAPPTPTSYDATPGYYTTSSLPPTTGQVLKVAGLLAGGLVLGLLTVPASHPWRGRRR
jgi:hypothetical protein